MSWWSARRIPTVAVAPLHVAIVARRIVSAQYSGLLCGESVRGEGAMLLLDEGTKQSKKSASQKIAACGKTKREENIFNTTMMMFIYEPHNWIAG